LTPATASDAPKKPSPRKEAHGNAQPGSPKKRQERGEKVGVTIVGAGPRKEPPASQKEGRHKEGVYATGYKTGIGKAG